MGTPDFAVSSLSALLDAGHKLVGVITAPDKPKGRGQQVKASPVKIYAEEKGLNVLQPTNLKDPAFQKELKSLGAELQVVVAFRMLPEAVINLPPKGSINLHGSLLPQYRGAAPINWAIINGEEETGVSTFFIKYAIDTGNIIEQERIPIKTNDTAGSLHDRMKEIGAKLLANTVAKIESGEYKEQTQEENDDLKVAPKLSSENCRIDWTGSAQQVYNHIRGLSPYPGAWTQLDGKLMKILKAELWTLDSGVPGTLVPDGKELHVLNTDGSIKLLEIKLEGKKAMAVAEFLNGYEIKSLLLA